MPGFIDHCGYRQIMPCLFNNRKKFAWESGLYILLLPCPVMMINHRLHNFHIVGLLMSHVNCLVLTLSIYMSVGRIDCTLKKLSHV